MEGCVLWKSADRIYAIAVIEARGDSVIRQIGPIGQIGLISDH
jgi:hypothetical protein